MVYGHPMRNQQMARMAASQDLQIPLEETSFYRKYLDLGIEVTQAYLDSYSWMGKSCVRHSPFRDNIEYLSAEKALEKMLEDQGE